MLCFTFVLAVQLAALSSYCDASADTSVRPSPSSEVAVVNAGVDYRQCILSSTKLPITCSGDIPINCSAPGTIDYVFQMRNTTAAEFQNVTADDNKSCLSANYTSGIGLYTFTPGDLDYQRVFKCIAYDANGASINEIQVLVEFHSDEKSTWKLKSGPSQTEGDVNLPHSSGDSFSAPQATGVCSSDFTLGRNRLDYTVCFLDEKESDLYDVAHTPCLLARGVIRCCRCGSICPGLPNVTTKATKLGNDKLACHVSTSQVGQIVCLGKIVNSNDNSQYITNQVIGSYKTVLSSPHSQNLDLPEWSYFLFGVAGLLIVGVPLLAVCVIAAVRYVRRRNRRPEYQVVHNDEGEGNRDAPVDNPYQSAGTVAVPSGSTSPPTHYATSPPCHQTPEGIMSSEERSGPSAFIPAYRSGDDLEEVGSDVHETPSGSALPEKFKALDEHPVKIHLLAQFICDMAPQWLPIAAQLGPKVSEKAHSDIDKRQCSDNEKMTIVLNSWIDSGENVCWNNILSAIHKVGMQSLTQEMLKLLPDLLTSQAKPSVDAERYDGIPVSLPLVADFVQRMCGEWYRIASCFGGRTAIEAHGQIDLDPSPASTKMSKVIEVWIGSVDGDVRWSVLTDALRTVGLGGVANDIRKKLDKQLSQLDSDGPGGGPTEDPAPAKTMRPVSNSKSSGSSSFPSSSDGPTPTAHRAGMDEKIGSSLDIFGVPAYRKGLIGQMPLLGTVLGIEEDTDAILTRSGSIDTQLMEILNRYIREKSPTWRDFCTALKKYESFNNVREKIEADHY